MKAISPPSPLFDTLEELVSSQKILPEFINAADFNQAHAFLYSYRNSPATFNAYRREVERLLQWCTLIAKKSLNEIRRNELEAYIEFCIQPPKTWIGLKKAPRYLVREGARSPNPDWRPFVATVSKVAYREGMQPAIDNYHLSPKALQEVFTVCGSFFQFLLAEGYVDVNPVSLLRQKGRFIKRQQSGTLLIRRLSELQWAYVIETAERLAKESPNQHERTLFIMTALYALYLRISELAASKRWAPQMGHFFRDMDGHWWFKTLSKGNKERLVSVSDAMLDALKRWRRHLKLPTLPAPNENFPLLPKMRGRGAMASTRHIFTLVQYCFDSAILRMQQEGFQDEAKQLQYASTHWLRHTGISEDVKTRPREHVRDDAGHSSSAITDRYIDIELRERHASKKKKPVKVD